jgi:hypothetical protein
MTFNIKINNIITINIKITIFKINTKNKIIILVLPKSNINKIKVILLIINLSLNSSHLFNIINQKINSIKMNTT